MKATLDCLECVLKQALRAARIATPDPELQRRILNETAARISSLNLEDSPAEVSLCAYELAAQIAHSPDPYKELRREQNELALRLEPELRRLVETSPDKLQATLHLSAAGNVIDLGTQHSGHIDVQAAIEQVMRESFIVDHIDPFRDALSRCKDLLFFLDNAGEIVFDKILIEELLKWTSVTAVVKAAPIINDAVLEDAVHVGLTEVCEVIDNGGAYIGSPLKRIPDWLRSRMARADVILGKGQGNYETLDDYPGEVFLILRAKCEVVARHMGVKLGQVALISTRARSAVRT